MFKNMVMYRIAPQWQASLDFQRFRQDASLALFELSGRVLQIGLQRAW